MLLLRAVFYGRPGFLPRGWCRDRGCVKRAFCWRPELNVSTSADSIVLTDSQGFHIATFELPRSTLPHRHPPRPPLNVAVIVRHRFYSGGRGHSERGDHRQSPAGAVSTDAGCRARHRRRQRGAAPAGIAYRGLDRGGGGGRGG